MQNKKVISTLIGIIIIVVVAFVLFGGIFIYQYFSTPKANNQPQIQNQQQQILNRTFPLAGEPADQTAGWKTYTNNTYNYQIYYDLNSAIEKFQDNSIKIKYQNGSIFICSRGVGACGNMPGVGGEAKSVNKKITVDGKDYYMYGYILNGAEALALELPNNINIYLNISDFQVSTESKLLQIISTFKFTK